MCTFLAEALLAWNLNLPETEEYMNKLVSSAESAGVSLAIKNKYESNFGQFFRKKRKVSFGIILYGKIDGLSDRNVA